MALVKQMQAKAWEVFSRPAFEGVEGVYDYLGRYVNRIAISNYRILDIRAGRVSFSYHDNKDKGEDGRGQAKVMSRRGEFGPLSRWWQIGLRLLGLAPHGQVVA